MAAASVSKATAQARAYAHVLQRTAIYGEILDPSGLFGTLATSRQVHVTAASRRWRGFKVDHPLDPENKYLSHSFVESPDMMNIYNATSRRTELAMRRSSCRNGRALNRDSLSAHGDRYGHERLRAGEGSERDGRQPLHARSSLPGSRVSWQSRYPAKDAWAEAAPHPRSRKTSRRPKGRTSILRSTVSRRK